ncbi:MAG: type I restriction enzyme HsdR N-terminal domain-containing protein [Chloroflexota bacterium]|nr:type I restriction enzyme HsdR N-terminal domain-containing protein [Chloroflexota bacterium]MDE2961366.1 type I restriction enzyme HsdR N-terminal domain-containing protein [Chloroflexota bacterium]
MAVDLTQMTGIIEMVRENISKQPEYDKFNEARTREAIVAPILRSMGWDVADFGLVDVEYSVHGGEGARRVDYALWSESARRTVQGDKPVTLLEAKGVDEDLDAKSVIRKIRHYAFEAGVPYVILTNGKIWQAHAFPSAVLKEHHRLHESVDIHDDSIAPYDCAKTLAEMFDAVLASPKYSLTSGWTPVKNYLNIKKSRRNRHPTAIRFPDGQQFEVRFWSQLMEHAGNWLCVNGHLHAGRLPVLRNSRSAQPQTLVSDEDNTASWKEVGDEGLFVWTGGGPMYAPDDLGDLLVSCGLDQEDVYLRVPR